MGKPQTRNRLIYVLLIAFTIFLGLASRKFSHFLPWWMAKNAGDLLYAVMAFWLVGFLVPTLSTFRAALAAIIICFGIEFLKFWQIPWLVTARHTTAGALVLGSGFHVSNLVCYTLGVTIAAVIELFLRPKQD